MNQARQARRIVSPRWKRPKTLVSGVASLAVAVVFLCRRKTPLTLDKSHHEAMRIIPHPARWACSACARVRSHYQDGGCHAGIEADLRLARHKAGRGTASLRAGVT